MSRPPGEPRPDAPGGPAPNAGPRPLIERLGLAAIAIVVSGLFGAIAVAALTGGEIFLAAMAGIGALMTVWAGASTLRRG